MATVCTQVYTLPALEFRSQNTIQMPDLMSLTQPSNKWINEAIYKSTVLSLGQAASESEAEEKLRRDAQELGLRLPVQKPTDVSVIANSSSATHLNGTSPIPRPTVPTSCNSSDRRPSTSLSQNSSRMNVQTEIPSIAAEMQSKRSSGFKSGLRKMTGFRRKRTSASSTPSIASMHSQMTGTTANGSTRSPPKGAPSIRSGNSDFSHESPLSREIPEAEVLASDTSLQRSLECEQLMSINLQQLEEKRRFLEYQTSLMKELLEEKHQCKESKRAAQNRLKADQEEVVSSAMLTYTCSY